MVNGTGQLEDEKARWKKHAWWLRCCAVNDGIIVVNSFCRFSMLLKKRWNENENPIKKRSEIECEHLNYVAHFWREMFDKKRPRKTNLRLTKEVHIFFFLSHPIESCISFCFSAAVLVSVCCHLFLKWSEIKWGDFKFVIHDIFMYFMSYFFRRFLLVSNRLAKESENV